MVIRSLCDGLMNLFLTTQTATIPSDITVSRNFPKPSFHSTSGTCVCSTPNANLWVWLSRSSKTHPHPASPVTAPKQSLLALLPLITHLHTKFTAFASALVATTVFLKGLLSRHFLLLLSTYANAIYPSRTQFRFFEWVPIF